MVQMGSGGWSGRQACSVPPGAQAPRTPPPAPLPAAVLAMSAHNPRGDQCMDWSSNHRDAAGVITDFLKKHG